MKFEHFLSRLESQPFKLLSSIGKKRFSSDGTESLPPGVGIYQCGVCIQWTLRMNTYKTWILSDSVGSRETNLTILWWGPAVSFSGLCYTVLCLEYMYPIYEICGVLIFSSSLISTVFYFHINVYSWQHTSIQIHGNMDKKTRLNDIV